MSRAIAGVLLAFGLTTTVGGAAAIAQAAPDVDPRIVRLVGQISEERLAASLRKLESFGTRNTLSAADTPGHGIGAARHWIFDELKGYSPALQVSYDTYRIAKQGRITRDVEARNIMAVLPGRSPRRIYVSGHYDTVAVVGGQRERNSGAAQQPATIADPEVTAPGVNDDGSGVALTMELARIFSQSGMEFEATLVFMCHVAEEQGLMGAKLHARKARTEHIPIDAVLNNDIVGNDRGGNGIIDGASIRVYSEGPEDSASRELARYVQRWGSRYVPSHRVRLLSRPDRFSRGGDHTAYNQYGFAAVGFRESRENFMRQHDPRDTFEGVSPAYLAQNARVNAAAAASLALAPAAPVVVNEKGQPTINRAPSGYDAHLQWKASPGASAYRIFWREAWGPDWQHEMLVGNTTEVTLPNTLIDDLVFGVAAVDAAGHESLVSPYIAPMSTAVETGDVKTVPP
jgi:peptidase M28-like protein